jgi:hypothetical protein
MSRRYSITKSLSSRFFSSSSLEEEEKKSDDDNNCTQQLKLREVFI